MQIKNINKRFTAIPTMIKHENHTIDNRAKLSEKSNDFLRSLVKSLKLKFLHPMEGPWECQCYLQPAIMRIFPVVSIKKQSPSGVL